MIAAIRKTLDRNVTEEVTASKLGVPWEVSASHLRLRYECFMAAIYSLLLTLMPIGLGLQN